MLRLEAGDFLSGQVKLELHSLNVKSLKFADTTGFSDGEFSIRKAELLALIHEDPRLGKNIDANITFPEETTRIMPVKDVIEPR